ncbi:uncharacterized protein ALTATR162_LOCUS10229 [Alternaria atra]|uniref:Uncharacterized protein n=1 Tax=Alternaria atra TaxID=119953 RepID=A0A8J2N4G6_9PLEO|nr:uncharacterized protein ALTATR162_LOCUS10229 [Alternaria atra]CAG5182576.1 unnamed protein product [Alternaria atra]
MHLPSHKLQLRPKLATVLQHSTDNSNTQTPEASAPAKKNSDLNIKDKRNIKIGIVALRTVSKWTDKAALTLEKLEGQNTLKHCQERQARLAAENCGRTSGKGTQETGVWRETVVYPVPAQASVSGEIELRDEPNVYQKLQAPRKEVTHDTVKVAEIPGSKAHHAHVLTTVVEDCHESSDDEDEGKACRGIDIDNDTGNSYRYRWAFFECLE